MKIKNRESAIEWLKEINTFDDNGGLTSKASLRMKKDFEILKSFQDITGIDSSNPSELIYSLIHPEIKGICEVCGRPTQFLNFKLGYRKSCCKECADFLTQSKGERTKEEKYGNSKFNNVEKMKQTKLERYGDPGYRNVEKGKATKLLKYGHMNYNNDEKRRQTCIEKYGVDNASKLEPTKEKIRQTCIERYGVDHPMKSKEVVNNYTSRFRETYGCDWPQQNPSIHKKTLGHYSMTSPESKMFNFLKNRGFSFENSYEINGKNYDFAIFKEDKLSILVEIDGKYFHGLLSDYDGVNVRGENDFLRFSKCPDGVKLVICDEDKVERAFEDILKVFDMSYEDWVNSVISMLPKKFPYPKYSADRMKKDFEHLCNYDYKKNQHLGMSLINNFHKSVWEAHVKGKPSPEEAWKDRSLLEKCVRNRFIYASNLSTQNILNGFNVCKLAPKVSVFNPSLAKHLISKYLNDYETIFDPFSGFSGRMLGALACDKLYIGQDINPIHIDESCRIRDFLGLEASLECRDVLLSDGEYECLFTCPPYGNKEIWGDENTFKSCDEWVDECLSRFNCKSYLFVVDKTEKYKNNIVEVIKNESHLGSNEEYVVLL